MGGEQLQTPRFGAVNPVADARDTSEPLQIDMEEIAGVGPFIASDRRGGVEQRQAIDAGPRQQGVTVDRDIFSALLICQAVARVRRSASTRLLAWPAFFAVDDAGGRADPRAPGEDAPTIWLRS